MEQEFCDNADFGTPRIPVDSCGHNCETPTSTVLRSARNYFADCASLQGSYVGPFGRQLMPSHSNLAVTESTPFDDQYSVVSVARRFQRVSHHRRRVVLSVCSRSADWASWRCAPPAQLWKSLAGFRPNKGLTRNLPLRLSRTSHADVERR